jgi:hypothetical protein
MRYSKDDKREFGQLWIIAKYYFRKAIEHYQRINNTQLSLTVKEIAERCENESEIIRIKNWLLASADFASCSVRLYSIDEKQNSNIFQSYKCRIWIKDNSINSMDNSDCVRKAYEKEKNKLTHIVLRHMVAHSETESRDYKKAFQILYSDYMNYTILFIKDNLSSIKGRIENDIRDAIVNVRDINL